MEEILFSGEKTTGTQYDHFATDGVYLCSGYAMDFKTGSREEHKKKVQAYDSFGWGYVGEGPELLAIDMLATSTFPGWAHAWHENGDSAPWKHPARDLILKHYRAFTEEIVANLPDSWTMTSDEVLAWLEKKEKQ